MKTEYQIQFYNKKVKAYAFAATCNTLERARIQAKKSYYTNVGKTRIIKVTYEIVK